MFKVNNKNTRTTSMINLQTLKELKCKLRIGKQINDHADCIGSKLESGVHLICSPYSQFQHYFIYRFYGLSLLGTLFCCCCCFCCCSFFCLFVFSLISHIISFLLLYTLCRAKQIRNNLAAILGSWRERGLLANTSTIFKSYHLCVNGQRGFPLSSDLFKQLP